MTRRKRRRRKPSWFRAWWRRLWCGTWTQNRLLSRKWSLVALTCLVAVALDAVGRALSEPTLTYLGIAVPAYLLVEGALDWGHTRKSRKSSKPETPADEEVEG